MRALCSISCTTQYLLGFVLSEAAQFGSDGAEVVVGGAVVSVVEGERECVLLAANEHVCVCVLLSVSVCVCGQLEAKHRAVYGGGA